MRETVKVIKCGVEYYSYPKGIENIESFIQYLNEHYHSFIEMKMWKEDNCCAPYFIESEFEYRYVNVAHITDVTEEEITLLSKEEYDSRLAQVVKNKCIHCIHFEDDSEELDLKGHRSKLSLDGECFWYRKAK